MTIKTGDRVKFLRALAIDAVSVEAALRLKIDCGMDGRDIANLVIRGWIAWERLEARRGDPWDGYPTGLRITEAGRAYLDAYGKAETQKDKAEIATAVDRSRSRRNAAAPADDQS